MSFDVGGSIVRISFDDGTVIVGQVLDLQIDFDRLDSGQGFSGAPMFAVGMKTGTVRFLITGQVIGAPALPYPPPPDLIDYPFPVKQGPVRVSKKKEPEAPPPEPPNPGRSWPPRTLIEFEDDPK